MARVNARAKMLSGRKQKKRLNSYVRESGPMTITDCKKIKSNYIIYIMNNKNESEEVPILLMFLENSKVAELIRLMFNRKMSE